MSICTVSQGITSCEIYLTGCLAYAVLDFLNFLQVSKTSTCFHMEDSVPFHHSFCSMVVCILILPVWRGK